MKIVNLIPLSEAIPNKTIFSHMTTLSFIPDSDVASYLDDEYFYNHSGTKQISPLVESWSERSDLDPTVVETRLANIILNRYRIKWEQLFRQYAGLSTVNLLNNINVMRSTVYGKQIDTTADNTITKEGSETHTIKGTETRTETVDSSNPTKASRAITGSYTDATTETSTRTGTQEVMESFPEDRKSVKVTSGGYTDTDTTTNTRTGSQMVTDKGGTATSVFGFNSSSGVRSQVIGPDNSETGITTETTYGTGLVDTHSGGVARSYNPVTGLKEETSESGQRKTATTFGENGLQDSIDGGTTRTYNNYKDELVETGSKSLSIDYGQNGKTDELSFDGRSDVTSIDETIKNSGEDSVTETGYNYKSLVEEYLALFSSAEFLDFLAIVYDDCDEVLTCPFYV